MVDINQLWVTAKDTSSAVDSPGIVDISEAEAICNTLIEQRGVTPANEERARHIFESTQEAAYHGLQLSSRDLNFIVDVFQNDTSELRKSGLRPRKATYDFVTEHSVVARQHRDVGYSLALLVERVPKFRDLRASIGNMELALLDEQAKSPPDVAKVQQLNIQLSYERIAMKNLLNSTYRAAANYAAAELIYRDLKVAFDCRGTADKINDWIGSFFE